MKIENIEPEEVFKYFKEISDIPRNSSNEEKVRNYIMDFANKRNLKYYTDEYYNIIVIKEADEEYEKFDTLAFQAHLDMVCEKTNDSEHDFNNDPIKLIIDGDYIKADNTTLGADNGTGVSIMLALLDSDIKTPKLECIFTVQEETTMLGVKKIDVSKITAKRIISLDCGKEGKMVISSADCMEWYGKVNITYEDINLNDYYIYKLEYSNFKGGHSGGNIADENRGNPIKLGIEILNKIDNIRIIDISSNGKVNVIPREFKVIFVIEKNNFKIENIEKNIIEQKKKFSQENIIFEKIENIKSNIKIMSRSTSKKIINFIYNYKNGALYFDKNNNYILSANLGAVNIFDEYVRIDYSLRSNDIKLKEEYLNDLNKQVKDNEIEIIWAQELYGFMPNYESNLVKKISRLYEEIADAKMDMVITQGVLEGGFFKKRMEKIDYVAIGPNTYDVHSPYEKLSISSMKNTWEFVKKIVKLDFRE